MEKVRRNKRSMHVAPEGTRSPDGEIQSFKKGAFHIAIQSRFPMHILVVCGAWELMPPGRFYAKPGVIRIRHLPPIDTSEWKRESITEHMEEVRSRMVETYGAMRE